MKECCRCLLWFEYEMSPTASCVKSLGLQLVALFWEVLEILRGRAYMEEVTAGMSMGAVPFPGLFSGPISASWPAQ
jgi:hypothetical protein